MKTLFVICITIKFINYAYRNKKDLEAFYFFKCMLYLICSSIHSVIMNIPLPVGACIISIIYFFDHKNKKTKLSMIALGLFIIPLSIFDYTIFTSPLQKLYIYSITRNVSSLEVYTKNSTTTDLLFSISDSNQIATWLTALNNSNPISNWHIKNIPESSNYLIKLHTNKKSVDIFLSPYSNEICNMYVGHKYIPYTNTILPSFINNKYPLHPTILTINTSINSSIGITNTNILDVLWRNLMWQPKNSTTFHDERIFSIPSYLFFKNKTSCRILFSNTFEYAYIEDRGIVHLSPYLSTTLNEQFILSQLNPVSKLRQFKPAHIHSKMDLAVNFSIEQDSKGFYNGLYKHDYTNNEKFLLHTVNSLESKFFILKNPYILLLDKKSHNQYLLMLINQNIPEKHRYIEKDEYILPHSISICPQNLQFAYILNHNHSSTLYLVSNYYHSPKSIATGMVNDSLFLSSEYLTFTQKLGIQNFLCVYNTTQLKVVKYIPIPGDIMLIEAKDNKIYFVIQETKGKTLKEGVFTINADLTIHKVPTFN